MARPKKKGVDYFPHDCITGKTIFTLEQKFGNDGYAFWFKLLEYLGTKEGHFLDCNDLEDMEFLQAKTRLDEIMICRMLDLLANLKAIDRDLWSVKVVWSQRFVDGISDVYVNRRVETPSKPDYYIVSTGHNPASGGFSEQPTSKSTQSKVKESKVEESKVNGIHAPLGAAVDSVKKKVVTKKSNDMSTQKEEIPLLPFQEPEFAVKWEEWLEYRKQRKLPKYVPIGLKGTFTKLKRISLNDVQTAIAIIQQSMDDNYQGLFPLKQNFNGKTNQRESSTVGKTIEFDRP